MISWDQPWENPEFTKVYRLQRPKSTNLAGLRLVETQSLASLQLLLPSKKRKSYFDISVNDWVSSQQFAMLSNEDKHHCKAVTWFEIDNKYLIL